MMLKRAVDPLVPVGAFEAEDERFAGPVGGDVEIATVPAGAAEIIVAALAVLVVPGVGDGDGLPGGVVDVLRLGVGCVSLGEFPFGEGDVLA